MAGPQALTVKIPLFQIEAFTQELFRGNPAAVCPLQAWLPVETLQAIAGENNLPETAFFVPNNDRYDIRWFSPTVEVELCGHATLAAAFVIFSYLEPSRKDITFQTLRAGVLRVEKRADKIALDFPTYLANPAPPHPALYKALGTAPKTLLYSNQYLAIYDNPDEIRALKPDMTALTRLDETVIVSAKGKDADFVSRFFAPSKGIPEDPVTGSAHCTLAPYWGERLGKSVLHARQLSPRGGQIDCELVSDRVVLLGDATCYLQGTIYFE